MDFRNRLVWLLAAACLAAVAGCSRPSPEQRLREQVAALQAAVEARSPGQVREVLADDFIGPGGMDRERAVRLAQVTFLRHREVGATLAGPLQVRMQDGHATVSFDVALTGGSGRLLPDAARLYSVETGWRLDDGEWRLVSATWEATL